MTDKDIGRTLVQRLAVVGALLLAGASEPAWCGPFEDGIAAYDRGEFAKAVTIMTPLAEKGNVAAQFNLGLAYANGTGIGRDDAVAVGWFVRAASADYAPAELLLGVMLSFGRGTAVDKPAAVRWFEIAARHGNAAAQLALAQALLDGEGIAPDDKAAVRWFRRSALQGNANAQMSLGAAYADGRGVEKDQIEAYSWMLLATGAMPKSRARDMAFELREKIGSGMDTAARKEATRRAAAFKPAPDPEAVPEGTLDLPPAPVPASPPTP